MAQVLTERSRELRSVIGSIVELSDPVGVLSVTAGLESGAGSGGTPPWQIAVQNDLARLRREGLLGRDSARSLADVSAQLEELLVPTSGARGGALYLALGSGALHTVTVDAPLPTGARVGPVAHVLPLLRVLEEGEVAGLVMASKDMVVLFEAELGRVLELERLELEPWVGDWWPEMKGPARANPLRGQHAVSQRDRYARRLAVAYRHTLQDATLALGALASERGWGRAAVAGDPRTTAELDATLRAVGVSTITIPANLEGVSTDDALRRLERALDELTAELSLERVRRALDEAAAGARGACGLAHVLVALNEARVASLLIDPAHTYRGKAQPDGILSSTDAPEKGVDLTDLIVLRALSIDAEVHAVHGASAEHLLACDGIAALLRW